MFKQSLLIWNILPYGNKYTYILSVSQINKFLQYLLGMLKIYICQKKVDQQKLQRIV